MVLPARRASPQTPSPEAPCEESSRRFLGFKYWGCDLRLEQIEANHSQASEMLQSIEPARWPLWLSGDSVEQLQLAPRADLIFTCPPYGNLERYSDDPRDLSTMEYPAFLQALKKIFARAVGKLKPEGQAVVVVGDFRDKATRLYRGFPSDVIQLFRELGLGLINYAIVVSPVGSLPVRLSGQFEKGRLLGKTHQDVLCFSRPS